MSVPTPAKRKYGDTLLVEFAVDPKKTKFTVHQAILFEASPVFKAAYECDFKEPQDGCLSLPDDDAELYEHLVEWLYTNRVQLLHHPTNVGRLITAAQLNILADKYDILRLRNDICDAFSRIPKCMPQGPPNEITKIICTQTSVRCVVRELLVDWHVWNNFRALLERSDFRALLIEYPELHMDLMKAFAIAFAESGKSYLNPFTSIRDTGICNAEKFYQEIENSPPPK